MAIGLLSVRRIDAVRGAVKVASADRSDGTTAKGRDEKTDEASELSEDIADSEAFAGRELMLESAERMLEISDDGKDAIGVTGVDAFPEALKVEKLANEDAADSLGELDESPKKLDSEAKIPLAEELVSRGSAPGVWVIGVTVGVNEGVSTKIVPDVSVPMGRRVIVCVVKPSYAAVNVREITGPVKLAVVG